MSALAASADRVREEYFELLKRALTGILYPVTIEYVPPALGDTPQAEYSRKVYQQLAALGMKVTREVPFDDAKRESGKDWPLVGCTMVGMKRLNNVQACAEQVLRENVPGDFCETGVWRGGTTILMRAILKMYGSSDRRVWACDSFQGLPKPDVAAYPADAGYDTTFIAMLAVSLESVKDNFRRFGMLDEQVQFLEGWFKDTLPAAPIERLSLLRLDGDLYESTMDALTALYHRLTPGGFCIVDDYGSWPPCKKATDDFRASRGITDEIIPVDQTGVYWRKT